MNDDDTPDTVEIDLYRRPTVRVMAVYLPFVVRYADGTCTIVAATSIEGAIARGRLLHPGKRITGAAEE